MKKEIKKLLKAFDNNEPVTTIEMGGIGPGYEQAIQLLVFEIMRADSPLLDKFNSKTNKWEDWAKDTINKMDEVYHFSGAQVGAAKNLAYEFMKFGYQYIIDKAPEDRRIMVTKHFPTPPKEA